MLALHEVTSIMSGADLSTILTPALFKDILDYTFSWKGPVDVEWAGKFLMTGDPDNTPQVYDTVHFRALKPMSTLRPTIPDHVSCPRLMICTIPNTSSRSFCSSIRRLV